jgi:hypothetical protein
MRSDLAGTHVAQARPTTVLAAAGRRIDPVGAPEERFPVGNEGHVASAIRSVLEATRPTLIVSSAACGADILVLEAARDLQIPTRAILPFSRRAFRERSVADCPGDWASRYDALVAHRKVEDGNLVLLTDKEPGSDEQANAAYHKVTERLIDEVTRIRLQDKKAIGAAIVIWDLVRKDENDETGFLLDRALSHGWQIIEINTLNPSGNGES